MDGCSVLDDFFREGFNGEFSLHRTSAIQTMSLAHSSGEMLQEDRRATTAARSEGGRSPAESKTRNFCRAIGSLPAGDRAAGSTFPQSAHKRRAARSECQTRSGIAQLRTLFSV